LVEPEYLIQTQSNLCQDSMLCEQMFHIFDQYFSFAYTMGFFPFKWDRKGRHFLKICTKDWQFILWMLNNLILFIKTVFLGYQVYILAVENNIPKLVFENLFLFGYLISFIQNMIYWKTRKSFPSFYWRCTTFCNAATGKIRFLMV